jgi:hypothetical protein
VRTWSISAFFPEVMPAHLAHQSCTVVASDVSVAANRGLKRLIGFEPLKGKHISTVRMTIIAASKEKRHEDRD